MEPPYKRKLAPLSLAKISAHHKGLGDEVRYIKGNPPWLDPYEPDKIYITTLFTYDYKTCVDCINAYKVRYPHAKIEVGGILATLLPDKIKTATGITPHEGLWREVERCAPDMSIFNEEIDYSIGHTTRGCIRRCPYCVVKTIEPEYEEISDWDERIDWGKKKIWLYDNNFLACSSEHFENTINKLIAKGKSVDFNQGLDCRLMDDHKAKRLSEARIRPLRFAFDNASQEEPIKETVRLLRKYQDINVSNTFAYLLYNFTETPSEALRRAKVLTDLGIAFFAMRYQPLDTLTKNSYVGKHWTPFEADTFSQFFNVKFKILRSVNKQEGNYEYATFREERLRHLRGAACSNEDLTKYLGGA